MTKSEGPGTRWKVQEAWLESRAEDLVDAPKLLVVFIAIAAFLTYLRPVGWRFSWMFALVGFIPGILTVTAIAVKSPARFRFANVIHAACIVVMALVMWRFVAVSALGAMHWGFAYAIPRKLLVVIFRHSLMKSIDDAIASRQLSERGDGQGSSGPH